MNLQETKISKEDLFQEFLKRSRLGSLIFLILFLSITFVTTYGTDFPERSFSFGIVFSSACLARFLMSSWPTVFGGIHSGVFRKVFELNILLCGLAWGIFAYTTLKQYGLHEISFIIFFASAGIGAGAIASLTPHTFIVRAQITLIFLPILLLLTFSQSRLLAPYAILGWVYYLFLFVQSKVISEDIQRSMLQTKVISKQNDELLEARDIALKSSRLKNEFLAKISHEVRSPLNGLLGMTQILRGTNLSSEQVNIVHNIKTCGETLLTIVNDLLDFSKIEAGQFQIDSNPCQIRDCIETLVNVHGYRTKKKKVLFSYNISEEVPDVIMTDKNRLTQVIVNLLDNAFKFTYTGNVKFNLSVQSNKYDRYTLIFSIHDTGIGLSKEESNNVFDVFGQVDSSSSRQHPGTGLGLSISKKLCELLGGEIWYEGELGHGSSFYFTIQTQELRNFKFLPGVRNGYGQKHLTQTDEPLDILLVEDEPMNQMLFEAYFKKLGHHHTIVGSGYEALELLKTKLFDVVFMDVQLPLMDGLETTRQIRNGSEILRQPQIIALTANAMKGDREKCLQAGMNEYLSKPVRLEDIKQVLDVLFAEPIKPPSRTRSYEISGSGIDNKIN